MIDKPWDSDSIEFNEAKIRERGYTRVARDLEKGSGYLLYNKDGSKRFIPASTALLLGFAVKKEPRSMTKKDTGKISKEELKNLSETVQKKVTGWFDIIYRKATSLYAAHPKECKIGLGVFVALLLVSLFIRIVTSPSADDSGRAASDDSGIVQEYDSDNGISAIRRKNKEERAESQEGQTESSGGSYVPEAFAAECENDGSDPSKPVSSRFELAEAIRYRVFKGVEAPFVVYTENLSDSDWEGINSFVDTTFFLVKRTSRKEQDLPSDVTGVSVYYEKSECMIVYENIVLGKEIPSEMTKEKELAAVVKQALDQCISENMTDYQKELALHDYLVGNSDAPDDDNDYEPRYHTAYGALVEKEAVCQGYAYAFELLLVCAGIDCRYITGTASRDHAWNMVKVDNIWYHADAMWDDPLILGQEEKDGWIKHAYMNLSDDIISSDHNWKRSDYRSCNSLDSYYYKVIGRYFNNYEDYSVALREAIMNGDDDFEAAVKDYTEEKYGFSSVRDTGYTGSMRMEECFVGSSGFQVIRFVFLD